MIDSYEHTTGERVTLKIAIFSPRCVATDEWVCEWAVNPSAVEWDRRPIFGIDALQALTLALRTIGSELESIRKLGAELTWLGDADVGI